MKEKKKIILGISCGDINGIGLEIIIKVFLNNDLWAYCTPILYAPQIAINHYKELYGEFHDFNYNVIKKANNASSLNFNIIDISNDSIKIKPGEASEVGATIALESLRLVTEDLKNNRIDMLLTLPLNKDNINKVNKDFIGHTEYFSKNFDNTDNLMLLCNENLRIATVTNHISIARVASKFNRRLIEKKIKILIETLKVDFLIYRPRIAVLGLNPHAGDNGLVGNEETTIIKPVVQNFVERGYLVYGPYSADGFFGTGEYRNFDAILGMYHDQSLIPFKLMSFGKGVNYTAGMSIVRVSPDHGVGYDISGQNTASYSSVLSAISLGVKIYYNRLAYLDMTRKNIKEL